MKRYVLIAAAALAPLAAAAQEAAPDEEAARVRETIARIGCEAARVEKESAELYEVDDATCEIGRYDIKLNGDYVITSMTWDGPAEAVERAAATPGDDVPQEAVTRITAMMAELQCKLDTSAIEAIPEGGYRLDGVACPDGRFEIELDANLHVTNRTEK